MNRIVMDTGMFFRPTALHEAARGPDDIVIPAVAYAERLRQMAARGSVPGFQHTVADLGRIEPFGPREADRIMPGLGGLDPAAWYRLARDALIAGHVRPGDELWTTDPKDFVAVGVPERQIVAW